MTDALARFVVCHRPVKRRIVGKLHKDNPYGPVLGSDKQFTKRIRIHGEQEYLKPQHLRLPVPETDQQVKQRLFEEIRKGDVPEKEARQRSRKLFQSGRFQRIDVDPPPGKSGIVRDRAVRLELRRCLKNNDVDPDNFSKAQIKALVDAGKVCMASGVPIRRVVLLRTIEDPVDIPGKQWDAAVGRYIVDPDPRRRRIYDSQNNHHVEIREDAKGRWHGKVVTMFDAAKRVRVQKQTAVDHSDHDGQRFIMSLAEGEMVYMCHPQTKQLGYFVVFKIDKGAIHFLHHWDARPAKAKEDRKAREDVADGITPATLKGLGPEPGVPPYKVHVDPLGNICRINEGRKENSGDYSNPEEGSGRD